MSTVATHGAEIPAVEEHAHDHPDEKTYVKIALILGVLTALEVATYPAEDTLGSLVIPILLTLMVIKFWYVAAFFMHLKFDSVILTRIFYAGLLLAVAVYVIALTTFHVFGW